MDRRTVLGWFVSFVAMDEAEPSVWHKKPLSVIALYVFIGLLGYWEIRIPAPGEAVAALAVAAAAMSFRGEMRGKEKVAWMALLFAFLSLELTSIKTERKANEEMQSQVRWQEAEHFKNIGSDISKGLKEVIDHGDKQFKDTLEQQSRQFNATMHGLEEQGKSLAILKKDTELLARQISSAPLSSMSPEELGAKTRAVTQQMSDYRHSYQIQDKEWNLQTYDPLEGDFGGRMSQAEVKEYLAKAFKERALFTDKYEEGARKLIAQANLLRAEMVSRLQPPSSSPDDDRRASWFENPHSDQPNFTFLFQLEEMANYLNGLAGRLQSQGNY